MIKKPAYSRFLKSHNVNINVLKIVAFYEPYVRPTFLRSTLRASRVTKPAYVENHVKFHRTPLMHELYRDESRQLDQKYHHQLQ